MAKAASHVERIILAERVLQVMLADCLLAFLRLTIRRVSLPASLELSCATTLTDVVLRKQLLMDRMKCEQVDDMGHLAAT